MSVRRLIGLSWPALCLLLLGIHVPAGLNALIHQAIAVL